VPDHHETDVRALPVIRVYDRREVERYLAGVEEEAAGLERRLAAAELRRTRAERSTFAAAQSEASRDREAPPAVDDLPTRAIADARRILSEAEREVLTLRAVLREVLDELDTAHADVDPPVLTIADEARTGAGRSRFGTASTAAHPAAHERRPTLQSVATGPSLAG
jgi:hypothetical protein